SIVLEKVLVENYAAGGKSLARRDGKVIFIESVVPGDVVDVRLSKNKKDFAEGYPTLFHAYSTERVTPFCKHFGVCGGCQWQMLPYQKQLQYKQQQVWDNLTRIGKIPLPEMMPIAGADETTFYRNKLEYTFSTREFTTSKPRPRHPEAHLVPGEKTAAAPAEALVAHTTEASGLPNDEKFFNGSTQQHEPGSDTPESLHGGSGAMETLPPGGGALGFHAKGFFDKVVQIEECWLQPEPTNALRNALYDYAVSNNLSFYNFREHKGLLRNLQVRICTTGEVMINLVVGEADEKKIKNTLAFIDASFPQITTLLYTINLKWNDSLHDQQPIVYKGKGHVIEKLEDFSFKIGPKSFFQTNTKQAEKLYQVTREFAELNGTQTVYDLYCGTGSIGIFCSSQAKKIIGVDVVDAAIADANENGILNNITHASFFSGDVIEVCNTDFFAQHGRPDVIITDPPRAGMHEKLVHKILEMEAPIVVYVSCNPATQARDLALLDEHIRRVQADRLL
ncbi:MAG: 23S rRNA (uracil(1939)-C(5))-methyltransferase RlmD, partial [Bacteroidota bacterium]